VENHAREEHNLSQELIGKNSEMIDALVREVSTEATAYREEASVAKSRTVMMNELVAKNTHLTTEHTTALDVLGNLRAENSRYKEATG